MCARKVSSNNHRRNKLFFICFKGYLWIYEQFEHSVQQEIIWSKYVLSNIDGIDLEEMEGYIKYRANKMLRLLGLSELYHEYIDNPMKWIRAYVDNFDDTKTDFFEQSSRQYVKTSDLNGFDDL